MDGIKRNRVSIFLGGLMIAVAVVIDIVQWFFDLLVFGLVTAILTLAINSLISVGAWLLFYIWFRLHQVDFISPKRLLVLGGSAIGEIASLGILPAWSLGIGALVFMTWAEDRIYNTTGKNISVTGTLKAASGRVGGGPPPLPRG